MFRFRLEFLLRYRRQIEDAAMLELAKQIQVANDIENEMAEFHERAQDLTGAVEKTVGTCIPGQTFCLFMDRKNFLTQCGKDAEKRLKKAETQIEAKRQELIKASIDRKAIDKMKENQKKTHETEIEHKNQNTLEELAMLARIRREHED